MAARNSKTAVDEELAEAGMVRRGKRLRHEPHLIAHGSTEHRTLLGLDAPDLKPERREQLEKALTTLPESQVDPERKMQVTRDNFVPTTKFGPGDEVIDGWAMVAGRT